MTFGQFSKKYDIPRATVYSIMNKLKDADIDRFETYVEQHQNTNHLNDLGIAYILKERGLDNVETESEQVNRQAVEQFDKNSDRIAIDILRQELDTRNKQFDILQENYNDLANKMEQTNERLFELNKNQQLLMNQLQQVNLLDNVERYENNNETDNEQFLNNEETQKKGFFARLFS